MKRSQIQLISAMLIFGSLGLFVRQLTLSSALIAFFRPTVICAAITSRMNKAKLPTHVEIDACHYNIVKDSVILLEQLRTIDKKRLKDKVCHLDNDIIGQVDKALSVSLEMNHK